MRVESRPNQNSKHNSQNSKQIMRQQLEQLTKKVQTMEQLLNRFNKYYIPLQNLCEGKLPQEVENKIVDYVNNKIQGLHKLQSHNTQAQEFGSVCSQIEQVRDFQTQSPQFNTPQTFNRQSTNKLQLPPLSPLRNLSNTNNTPSDSFYRQNHRQLKPASQSTQVQNPIDQQQRINPQNMSTFVEQTTINQQQGNQNMGNNNIGYYQQEEDNIPSSVYLVKQHTCLLCLHKVEPIIITSCCHTFCYPCMINNLTTHLQNGACQFSCPTCQYKLRQQSLKVSKKENRELFNLTELLIQNQLQQLKPLKGMHFIKCNNNCECFYVYDRYGQHYCKLCRDYIPCEQLCNTDFT